MDSPLLVKKQGKISSVLIECGAAGGYACGEGRVPF